MAKIIVLANQKGGVCKSTSVLCIGSVLQKLGSKVLYVDLDKQCDTTTTLMADTNKKGSYEILKGDAVAKQCTQFIDEKYYVISASKQLSNIDDEIRNNSDLSNEDKLNMLDKGLQEVKYYFDFIIIDTPPNLNMATLNALKCADYIVIPCYADEFSLRALNDMYEVLNAINCTNKVGGILLTKYSNNRNLDKFVMNQFEEKAKYSGTKIFNTKIRDSVAIKESQFINKDMDEYAPKCNAYVDYVDLTGEILNDLGMLNKGTEMKEEGE